MLTTNLLLPSLMLTFTNAQTTPFDAREATIASLHDALFTKQNTCRDVVATFVARIEAYNPLINAIITLNPTALEEADRLDSSLSRGNATGSLFCIPILLKDNFDAVGMPTTAGCAALRDNYPIADAPTVSALRNAGAVILGKTNLQEFALEGLSVSSMGGQTLNPYDFTRTPGGSSGGTGAAVAASFAVFGTGTDTMNSLRSPASANGLYSFRPTYGLISRAGIVPVSWTQDAVGAIGRCLKDIATALTVMASISHNHHDNTSDNILSLSRNLDYTTAVSSLTSLKDRRIGVLTSFFDNTSSTETDPVNTLMSNTIARIRAAGAKIVYISEPEVYNTSHLSATLDVQRFELREQLDSYLSSPNLTGSHPQSMSDLYTSNLNTSNFLVIPSQHAFVKSALTSSTSDLEYTVRLAGIATLKSQLREIFTLNKLNAIIYPEQKNLVVPVGSPSQSGRNGILAALTGSPVVTIPIGFSNATETAPVGIPIGMEILGLPWSEIEVLRIAKGIDDLIHARRSPVTASLDESVEVDWYEQVPIVKPLGVKSIDLEVYPLGTLGN